MNRTRTLGPLFSLLAALALAASVLALTPGIARADDPSYPAPSTDPVANYGEPPASQLVTDVQVITGGSPDIQCPAGYTQRFPDLNKGDSGDYVYTCLKFGTDATQGIGELYVRSSSNTLCTEYGRNDQFVAGDLNSGVLNDLFGHLALYYCIHRPGTTGGSARIPHPPTLDTPGYNEYFPTPDPTSGKLLHDVQFLGFDADHLPSCVSTDCVDTSPVGAFAYLNAAVTIDPYCQRYFGPTYHPLLSPWEYESASGDRGVDVPQDAQVFNLNQGSLGKLLLYGCVSYITPDTTPPTITASATTADGRPYTANTWTNQDVTVTFTCADNAGGTGVASVSPPRTISGGANLPSVSGTCTDHANNTATVNFGPILIDQITPRITATATTADGQPYTAGAWTNQAVTVHFSCAEDAAASYISGVASDTVAGATLTGEGANQSVTSTGACTDNAGNAAAPVTFGPVNIDQTKPVITARATTADGQPYTPGTWTNQHVTVAFACADTGPVQSGLATNTLASQTLNGDGANLAATNSGACVDQAGNTADPVTLGGIKIDQTPPQISITAPTATTYLLHQAIAASYACADPLADGVTPGSGVVACAGIVANGGALDTASVGTKTFTITARDAVGNTTSRSVTYTVAYNVCVLYDQAQAHKAGSTVPIKLALCDASGANISADTSVVTATGLTQVSSDAPGTVVDAGDANPDDNFRYAGGFYLYNLQTTGLTTGTWQLSFTVAGDPTTHTVQFQVR
ncbi:MAG TPA: PxKF domain-containing protein [Thermomicrobiales bacterium]|nr:PxKF domain-containing protein [Thermomicrobiales bacterium]